MYIYQLKLKARSKTDLNSKIIENKLTIEPEKNYVASPVGMAISATRIQTGNLKLTPFQVLGHDFVFLSAAQPIGIPSEPFPE